MDSIGGILLIVVSILIGAAVVLAWRRRRPDAAPVFSKSHDTAATPPPPVPSVSPQAPDLDEDLVRSPTGEHAKRDEPALVGDAKSAPEPARFSAWYPKEAAPNAWLPLRAYVFRLSAAEMVEKDAAEALKDQTTGFRPVSGDAAAPLAEGALITATPELPGFQINPPSASVAFYEDWHALVFRVRAADATLEQAVNGRITFAAEGVIVADLPVSVFVTAQPANATRPATASANADPYDAIFCSYSHRDTAIVERVERAYRALGLDYLRDVTTLRSGEDWNARLLNLIDEADIFQLFWSNAAAESPYVRQEWEHALSLERGDAFVRPVYWEKPMPKAPDALRGLHFHFDPTLDD